MRDSEKILRRIGWSGSISAEDIAFVDEVISAYNEERALMGKKTSLPTKFVAVGDEVVVSGRRMLCVARGRINVPSEACIGCAFSKLYLGCGDLQCGPFDRRDTKFVWFKEIV